MGQSQVGNQRANIDLMHMRYGVLGMRLAIPWGAAGDSQLLIDFPEQGHLGRMFRLTGQVSHSIGHTRLHLTTIDGQWTNRILLQ